MISAECDNRSLNCRFVIRPNRSLTWRGTLTYFAGISLMTTVIALMFTLKGAWVILPFAGLEILALGVCLYITACKNTECEVVYIGDDVVRVERGRYRPYQTYELTRAWAQVALDERDSPWYPSRLTIRSSGQEVEVGARISEEERAQLARELRSRLK